MNSRGAMMHSRCCCLSVLLGVLPLGFAFQGCGADEAEPGGGRDELRAEDGDVVDYVPHDGSLTASAGRSMVAQRVPKAAEPLAQSIGGSVIVAIAVAEEGRGPEQVGQDLGYYPYELSLYIDPGEAWCSEFVSWAFVAAGCPFTGGWDPEWMLAGSTQIRSWYQSNAIWVGNGDASWSTFQPGAGDYIRYDTAGGGHSGIVRYSEGDTLYTVEGNVNNQVWVRTISDWRNRADIDGFGVRETGPDTCGSPATGGAGGAAGATGSGGASTGGSATGGTAATGGVGGTATGGQVATGGVGGAGAGGTDTTGGVGGTGGVAGSGGTTATGGAVSAGGTAATGGVGTGGMTGTDTGGTTGTDTGGTTGTDTGGTTGTDTGGTTSTDTGGATGTGTGGTAATDTGGTTATGGVGGTEQAGGSGGTGTGGSSTPVGTGGLVTGGTGSTGTPPPSTGASPGSGGELSSQTPPAGTPGGSAATAAVPPEAGLAPAEQSGCTCRTGAGNRARHPLLAGSAALLLGLFAMRRRRRGVRLQSTAAAFKV